MISEVVMPQMGADMEEGTVLRWLKTEGDEVERGEIIAEIETDKANVEIEAFESGVFRKALAEEGDTVDVGTVIAIIASADEDVSKYAAGSDAKPKAAPEAEPEGDDDEKTSDARAKDGEEEQARETPKPEGDDDEKASDARAKDGEEEQARETPKPEASDGQPKASPVARRLAKERGIDLAQIEGTGPGGRVVKRDIEDAGSSPAPAVEAPSAGTTVVPMSKMRQTIARRMAQSKREAPHYYITADVEMTDAEETRHQVNDARIPDLHVSVNDLIVKAVAIALERHPEFNAWFVDGEVRRHEAINVSIAIALDEGLIAPAILDCKNKRLTEISTASRDLAERAKSGTLKAQEYTGGTFTVSNLGMFDVETLIAIIQPPQTAILGVGSVRDMPVVRNGHVEPARLMKVALSADHRVTDGAQGARFLKEIRHLLEEPAPLLL